MRNIRLSISLSFCFMLAALVSAEDFFEPAKPGPYPTGVTTLVLVDHARTDSNTKGPRTLLTDIWYPAADDQRGGPVNKFSDFYMRGQIPKLDEMLKKFFKDGIAEVDKRFKNSSVRDARIRDGRFPLIVFSHGNGGIRAQNTFWCDYLASHGYIIMSADHTGNCAATVVDGKVIPYNVGQMMVSAGERPKDVGFMIDQMTKFAAGDDSRFCGRVDLEKIGVAGHSFGGFTSAAIIETDPRVDAIIPMTPVWPLRTNFTTPVMIFLGTEDKTIGTRENDKNRKRYEESQGPRFLVEVLDGGHFTFTDMFQADPDFGDGVGKGERVTMPGEPIEYLPMEDAYAITNTYSAAFFGVYVKGEPKYMDYLKDNHFGEKIIYKYALPEAVTNAAGQ